MGVGCEVLKGDQGVGGRKSRRTAKERGRRKKGGWKRKKGEAPRGKEAERIRWKLAEGRCEMEGNKWKGKQGGEGYWRGDRARWHSCYITNTLISIIRDNYGLSILS